MKMSISPGVYVFNFLFLFYTLIGPAKGLSYFLCESPEKNSLSEVEYITKVRLEKKYVQGKEILIDGKKQKEICNEEEYLPGGIKKYSFRNWSTIISLIYSISVVSIHPTQIPFYILFANLRF